MKKFLRFWYVLPALLVAAVVLFQPIDAKAGTEERAGYLYAWDSDWNNIFVGAAYAGMFGDSVYVFTEGIDEESINSYTWTFGTDYGTAVFLEYCGSFGEGDISYWQALDVTDDAKDYDPAILYGSSAYYNEQANWVWFDSNGYPTWGGPVTIYGVNEYLDLQCEIPSTSDMAAYCAIIVDADNDYLMLGVMGEYGYVYSFLDSEEEFYSGYTDDGGSDNGGSDNGGNDNGGTDTTDDGGKESGSDPDMIGVDLPTDTDTGADTGATVDEKDNDQDDDKDKDDDDDDDDDDKDSKDKDEDDDDDDDDDKDDKKSKNDESFFEKYKLPIIIGAAGVIVIAIVVVVIILVVRAGKKKQPQAVSGGYGGIPQGYGATEPVGAGFTAGATNGYQQPVQPQSVAQTAPQTPVQPVVQPVVTPAPQPVVTPVQPVVTPVQPVQPSAQQPVVTPVPQPVVPPVQPVVNEIKLACIDGTLAGNEFAIPQGETLIGRDTGCNIRFAADVPGVSRNHAKITRNGDQIILTDMNSSGGTFVVGMGKMDAGASIVLPVGSSFYLGEEKNKFIVK